MKILCVIQRFYPAIGGAENVMKQYLDYLSTNHEIVVYTSDALDLSSFWSKKNSQDIDTKEQNYLVKRFKILTPTEIHHDELLFPYSLHKN